MTNKMDDIEIPMHQGRQITSPSPHDFITYAAKNNVTKENDAGHEGPLVDWARIWLQGILICVFGFLGLIGNFRGYFDTDATINFDTSNGTHLKKSKSTPTPR